MDSAFWTSFYEIYEALPRQGPGDRASTERAVNLVGPLRRGARLIDIGCGSGAQTLDLARSTAADIVAVDSHRPFVARLRERAAEHALAGRIHPEVGDMRDLHFPDGHFDVVWAEGSSFIMGFAEAVRSWRRLLRPGGYLGISEMCWFTPRPPPEVAAVFLDGGEANVTDVEARRRALADAGYVVVGDFALPREAWWESYYVPLAEVLTRFRAAHAGDAEALAVADRSQREIELYRVYGDTYGYVFFVARAS